MQQSFRSIEQYLEQLRSELSGSDPALVQDAVSDAEIHLRTELARRPDALNAVIDAYGSPAEIAAAYRETDARVAAAFAPPRRAEPESPAGRILGVLVDPRAYSALVFMLLSLPIGVLYFTWALSGLAISLGFSILIFGLPVFLTYLASIRAFSLIEGRIVETLLAERMPRRPLPPQTEGSLVERILYWLKDRRTWATILYMLLRLPLGIVYFTVAVVLLAMSLALFVSPVAQVMLDVPIINLDTYGVFLPLWMTPLFWLGGALDLLLLLHLAVAAGRLQAGLAKAMLVGTPR